MYPHSVIQIVTAIILCVDRLIRIIISTATTKKEKLWEKMWKKYVACGT